MEERLNKLLARAGVASRRGADEMIAAGRVTVNGQVVTELGTKVDAARDEVRVDGERLRVGEAPPRYVALYKPRHVITSASDPYDRTTVVDVVDPEERLFPVGRLDAASEGLILLTNDGELANQLTHPRYEHEKEYRVKISGTPLDSTLRAWREGMWLEEGRTLPADVTIESSTGGGTWLRFVLREGKNRQLRRMVEAFHHQVHRLIRTRMGPIVLGTLKPGEWRDLTSRELAALRAGSNEPTPPSPGQGGREERKPAYKPGWARPKRQPSRHSRPTRGGADRSSKRARRGKG